MPSRRRSGAAWCRRRGPRRRGRRLRTLQWSWCAWVEITTKRSLWGSNNAVGYPGLRGGGRALRRQLHRHRLGDSRLFHGDAVERVGHLHGALVVGDDDELRRAAHLTHHLVVAAHVGFV